MNNTNLQLSALRSQVAQIESEITLASGLYGEQHGSVLALYEKLNLIKEELNKKVDLLIENGITNNDPLSTRNKQISQILELENSIQALKFNRRTKKKMLMFLSKSLIQFLKQI